MRSYAALCVLLLTAVTASVGLSSDVLDWKASANPSTKPNPQASIVAAPGTLGLGAVCSNNQQCANGASCYGVTSFTITTCGSFQAACQTDSQCATNTCNQGFCNGYLSPSSYKISPTSTLAITPPPVPTASTSGIPSVTALPGSLGLGAVCSANVQCANGASCYGVTSYTIRTCGSFQAVCQTDSQCATNTCNQGFCNGYLSPSSYRITRTSLTIITQSSNSNATASQLPGAATTTATRSLAAATTTAPPAAFTGAASKLIGGSSCALFCALVALVL